MYIIVPSGSTISPDRRALPRNSHFVAKPVRQDRLTESPMTSARERLTIEFADATIARHGGFTDPSSALNKLSGVLKLTGFHEVDTSRRNFGGHQSKSPN